MTGARDADGAVSEMFACGTAAVVTPVGVTARTGDRRVGDGGPGR